MQQLTFITQSFTEPGKLPHFRDIHVPYPPKVQAEDLIRRKRNGELCGRATNSFFIFRNEYSKALERHGYKLSMRDVARLAAESWREQPRHVVRTYEQIAKEAYRIHYELSTSLNAKNVSETQSKSHDRVTDLTTSHPQLATPPTPPSESRCTPSPVTTHASSLVTARTPSPDAYHVYRSLPRQPRSDRTLPPPKRQCIRGEPAPLLSAPKTLPALAPRPLCSNAILSSSAPAAIASADLSTTTLATSVNALAAKRFNEPTTSFNPTFFPSNKPEPLEPPVIRAFIGPNARFEFTKDTSRTLEQLCDIFCVDKRPVLDELKHANEQRRYAEANQRAAGSSRERAGPSP